jgi:hypothetical protein
MCLKSLKHDVNSIHTTHLFFAGFGVFLPPPCVHTARRAALYGLVQILLPLNWKTRNRLALGFEIFDRNSVVCCVGAVLWCLRIITML